MENTQGQQNSLIHEHGIIQPSARLWTAKHQLLFFANNKERKDRKKRHKLERLINFVPNWDNGCLKNGIRLFGSHYGNLCVWCVAHNVCFPLKIRKPNKNRRLFSAHKRCFWISSPVLLRWSTKAVNDGLLTTPSPCVFVCMYVCMCAR
jgi:hypothetical protein